MEPPVLQHPQVVCQGVVQAHHFQIGGLLHDLLGALPGDDDPGALSGQRLGALHDLPPTVGGHENVHRHPVPFFNDGPGLFRQLPGGRHHADLLHSLHLLPVQFLLHMFHLVIYT